MPAWQGKSKGSPLGYRIFISILKAGGLLPAYFLLRFVALYYLLFSFKSTQFTYRYFRRKHHHSICESAAKTYRNYYLFGQSIVDKVVIMGDLPNKFTYHFDGEENLKEIGKEKKGGLLLSAHIGNWEIAGHFLKNLDIPIHIVMFDGEREQIKDYLESVTGKRRVNIIPIKDDISHIFKINEALKNNELVCMHADRFIENNKTTTANFLDEPAQFPLGPFILAAKFNVPVSFVFAMKESTFHYHLFASKPKLYQYQKKEEAIKNVLDDFVAEMENKVKKYPEQWYNYYDFWQ